MCATKATQVLALIGLACPTLLSGACGDHGGSHQDARPDRRQDARVWSDAAGDAGPDADAALPDGRADALTSYINDPTKPAGSPVPGCDEAVWLVPSHGTNDSSNRVSVEGLDGADMVYFVTHGTPPYLEAFYVDLATCMEYPLNQIVPTGWDVTAHDVKHHRAILHAMNSAGDTVVYSLDVNTWSIRVLDVSKPDDIVTNFHANGRLAALLRATTLHSPQYRMQLVDFDSLDTTDVTSYEEGFAYTAMTDDLFVYEPLDDGCPSHTATWALDLHDFTLARIPQSCDDANEHIYFASGYRVGWAQYVGLGDGPYACRVVDLEQGWTRTLTQDDAGFCAGGMSGDIVLWNTADYATPPLHGQLDVMAMDLSNGQTRRLTPDTVQSGVGGPMSLPRATFYAYRNDIRPALAYIVNLQALGIVDDQGHLLAGPPIDELSALGDP